MNVCKKCVHDQDGHEKYCKKCNINPEFKNNFQSTSKYYPLELRGTHIIQWLNDGDYCISVAIFEYSESEESWDLNFVGNRPLINNINWNDFKCILEIGFNMVENNEKTIQI